MAYALCFFRQGKVGSESDQKPWWRVLVQVPGEGWGSPSQTAHLAESPAGEQCQVCSGQAPTTAGQVLGKELLPGREPGVPLTAHSPPQLGSIESSSHAGDGTKHHIESGGDTRPIPNPGKAGFEKRRNWQNVI